MQCTDQGFRVYGNGVYGDDWAQGLGLRVLGLGYDGVRVEDSGYDGVWERFRADIGFGV